MNRSADSSSPLRSSADAVKVDLQATVAISGTAARSPSPPKEPPAVGASAPTISATRKPAIYPA